MVILPNHRIIIASLPAILLIQLALHPASWRCSFLLLFGMWLLGMDCRSLGHSNVNIFFIANKSDCYKSKYRTKQALYSKMVTVNG